MDIGFRLNDQPVGSSPPQSFPVGGRERWFVWHGILFEGPNPTGSRPSDLIGLYKQHMKPHPSNTQGRARRKHGGEQGHPEEAESHPEEAERRKRKGTETAGSKEEDLGLRCGEAPVLRRPRRDTNGGRETEVMMMMFTTTFAGD